jgi:hypothetical protein
LREASKKWRAGAHVISAFARILLEIHETLGSLLHRKLDALAWPWADDIELEGIDEVLANLCGGGHGLGSRYKVYGDVVNEMMQIAKVRAFACVS